MGRVDNNGVGTGIDESLHAVEGVEGDTYTGSYAQTTLTVLTSHGLILGLGDILIGNQTNQMVVFVHNRQLLNLVLLQNLCSSNQVGLLMGRYQVVFRHDLVNGTVETALKAQVTVGNDTYEVIAIIYHRDTTDMILRHDVECLSNCGAQRNRDRIIDHTVLSTFHDGDLTGLIVDRHILVNHTNTAFTGNGNSHLRLGNRIHSGRYERHVQFDVTREAGFQLYCFWQNFRISRN